jgi:raffinose/stachyose/melibiose transport system substrate-binding protein
MKKSKTTLAALLSLALIGSTFAGCSNSASNKGKSSGTSDSTIKLELFSTKTENLDILKSLVSTFEEKILI